MEKEVKVYPPTVTLVLAEIIIVFMFIGFLSLVFKDCSSTGVIITGTDERDALKEAQDQYSNYEFDLAPATVGTHDGKYIVLCKIDGAWIKVGSGLTDELSLPEPEENAPKE